MKQRYIDRKFKAESLDLIAQCDEILRDYVKAGYIITVRTLYYQCVSRNIIPNTERSYKNLTSLINDARLAGLIDWDVIEDRGRRPITRPHWENGRQFLESVGPQFYRDMWHGQESRVLVVVEKDALAGVLEGTCNALDVPLLAAKGYPSASAVRDLVHEQMMPHVFEGWKSRKSPGNILPLDQRQRFVILHLGDHDPSGIDMSRDLEERLRLFGERAFYMDFHRIALNYEQVEELQPPPNPAKVTDSRFEAYAREHGEESWELDALPPEYLNELVRSKVEEYIDRDKWGALERSIERVRGRFEELAATFDDDDDDETDEE